MHQDPLLEKSEIIFDMNNYHKAFLSWNFRKTMRELYLLKSVMSENGDFESEENSGVRRKLDLKVRFTLKRRLLNLQFLTLVH